MSISPQPAEPEPAPWRLTKALDEKLAELRGRGLQLAWIECSRDDLTRLIVEGGEAAVRLDPDPTRNLAWYDGVEIRHSSDRPLTWVFLRGEDPTGEVSAHVVGPPDPDRAPDDPSAGP